MSALTIGLIVFGCVFGGALMGMLLRGVLPENHLSAESRDVVKLGTGLIGTMAALLLGLMIAFAKTSYDTQVNEMTEASAKILMLDRLFAHYGPEANEARALLRRAVAGMLRRVWAAEAPVTTQPASSEGELLYDTINQFAPASEP